MNEFSNALADYLFSPRGYLYLLLFGLLILVYTPVLLIKCVIVHFKKQ